MATRGERSALDGYDVAMPESTRQREERLRREGRHDEFQSRWKEEQAKCSNKPQRQAAWARVVEEFPPKATESFPAGDLVDPRVFEGKDCSPSEAVVWAASAYQDESITPADAPSSTAWSLVRWIRRSGGASFWASVYGRMLPAKSAIPAEPDDSEYEARMAGIHKDLHEEIWAKKRKEFEAELQAERGAGA